MWPTSSFQFERNNNYLSFHDLYELSLQSFSIGWEIIFHTIDFLCDTVSFQSKYSELCGHWNSWRKQVTNYILHFALILFVVVCTLSSYAHILVDYSFSTWISLIRAMLHDFLKLRASSNNLAKPLPSVHDCCVLFIFFILVALWLLKTLISRLYITAW